MGALGLMLACFCLTDRVNTYATYLFCPDLFLTTIYGFWLSRAPVLAHYDPQLPLKLDTDASTHGMGAVISHVFPNG